MKGKDQERGGAYAVQQRIREKMVLNMGASLKYNCCMAARINIQNKHPYFLLYQLYAMVLKLDGYSEIVAYV